MKPLLAALLVLSAAAAQAADRIPVVYADDGGAAPGFANFIARLRVAAAAGDRAPFSAALSPGYRYERDFGGVEVGFRTRAEVWADTFVLDPAQIADPGTIAAEWRRLAAILSPHAFGWQEMEDGRRSLCGPSRPAVAPDFAEPLPESPDDYYFYLFWRAVEGPAVVRAKPLADAQGIADILDEAVRMEEWDLVPGWLEVSLPDGRRGWIELARTVSFLGDQLCYRQDKSGNWLIDAYVGGGE